MAELTQAEQVEEIYNMIEESVTYYVLCDECRGCHDTNSGEMGDGLYDKGWRVFVNANDRVMLHCPECVTKREEANHATT